MVMAWMVATATAGDVWLVVDDSKQHVEVPAVWVASDGSDAVVRTPGGPVDLVAEVAALQRQSEGATRAFPLADGTLVLQHRPVAREGWIAWRSPSAASP